MNPRIAPGTLALALLFAACSGTRDSRPAASAPAAPASLNLLPASAYPRDFQWQQRVTAEWDGGRRSFPAVLSRAKGTLRLIGLDPMGRVGFALALDEKQGVEFEKHPSLEFPFDPRLILQDVQRIYFPLFDGDPGGDVVRRRQLHDLWVEESWTDGQLTRRTFSELPTRATVAEVTYTHGSEHAGVPEQAHYHNHRHHYRLHVRTLVVSEL